MNASVRNQSIVFCKASFQSVPGVFQKLSLQLTRDFVIVLVFEYHLVALWYIDERLHRCTKINMITEVFNDVINPRIVLAWCPGLRMSKNTAHSRMIVFFLQLSNKVIDEFILDGSSLQGLTL